jgi:nucleotide sugar dehydrogenase
MIWTVPGDREPAVILGLGYVGLTLSAALADVGIRTYGVDINPNVIDALNKGQPLIFEPGLPEIVQRVMASGKFTAHTAIPQDVDATVWIITVGTPLDADGRVRLDMIENAARQVAENLKAGDLVIMRSTVRIGATRSVVIPILESGGIPFEVAFCPERTVEGNALEELRRLPQIVGADNLRTAMRASRLFMETTPTVVRVQGLETAEMIKLVDNTSRDIAFAFSNEVARACDAIGISAFEVINAGKLGYPRTNLSLPGPVGGPCLTKDPYIFAQSLEPFSIFPDLALSARRTNERQPGELMRQVQAATRRLTGFPERPVVAVLGFAFKGRPITDDLRGSMVGPTLAALRTLWPNSVYRGYDPVVPVSKLRDYDIVPFTSMEDALRGANLAIIMNNHDLFGSEKTIANMAALAKPALVYDFWNHFTQREISFPDKVTYMAVGSHARRRTGEIVRAK